MIDYPTHVTPRPPRVSVLAEVKALSIPECAARIGYPIEARGMACPSCRSPTRRDGRPAAGLRADGMGWHCHCCQASGGAIELAGYALVGRVPKAGAEWGELARCLEARGVVATTEPTIRPPRVERPPVRPPLREVDAVWGACGPVAWDVGAWLVSRGLDPAAAARRDLVRTMPRGYSGPAWLPRDVERRRAVFAARDLDGVVRSLRFRGTSSDVRPKAAPPSRRGVVLEVRGLVLACPLAVGLLTGDVRTDRLVICEGEPDWLTCCESRPGWAAIGIWSGSWSQELADRIPSGSRVLIATDHDEAGAKYAGAIVASLRGRVTIERTTAGPLDENDRFRASH